jgi:predicted small secreted protein
VLVFFDPARIEFSAPSIIFLLLSNSREGITMSKVVIAVACLSLFMLAGCGNTARGLKQDGVQTSNALDNATHRVARASAN